MYQTNFNKLWTHPYIQQNNIRVNVKKIQRIDWYKVKI